MSKPKTVSEFIKENLWSILVMIGGGVLIFLALKDQVKANTKAIIEIKEEQAEYPSQDWFELKFDTIDDKFIILEKKINNCQDRL